MNDECDQLIKKDVQLTQDAKHFKAQIKKLKENKGKDEQKVCVCLEVLCLFEIYLIHVSLFLRSWRKNKHF